MMEISKKSIVDIYGLIIGYLNEAEVEESAYIKLVNELEKHKIAIPLDLYNKVIEFGEFKDSDNVLDLYCGVGTIGIIVSDYVNSVLGIEFLDEAVDLAEDNIHLNDINNVNKMWNEGKGAWKIW